MPIYEYECQKCGKKHEVIQKFSDSPLTVCPECGGDLKKLMSNTSFVLKGSGWYLTDYAKKPKDSEKSSQVKKTAEEKTAATSGSASEPKTEPKSEQKTGPKSDSKSESGEKSVSEKNAD